MSCETDPRPLDSFAIIRSRNIGEVREAVIRNYGARLHLPLRAEGLDVRVNTWRSQNIGLTYSSYGRAPAQLEFPAANFFRQYICLQGSAEIRFSRIRRQVTNEESWVVPPEIHTIDFAPSFEHFGLIIKADALLNKLAALTGISPSRKLVFDHTTRATGQAIANLRRLLVFLATELDDASGSKMPPLAFSELEQAALASFLCNNPNNYSNLLNDRSSPVASWQVRRAEEYIEAHWDQPITIEELARVTSASTRSLFHQFKRTRGQSPMAFVKELRLEHARDTLGRTDAGPSVTETALACGFTNLGHFASDYFKRFGERPSDTIKRRKGEFISSYLMK
jgi:AraC-like DNA-binding protein